MKDNALHEYSSDELIDEAELRAALLPMRSDRERFESGIRQRVELAEAMLLQKGRADETKPLHSGWLKVAAAVIPFPLLGKTGSGGLVKLGQLSMAEKIFAVAALPATGLLLMVTASLWALIKIRRAQRRKPADNADALALQQVLVSWWRSFGLLTFSMSGGMLLLMFLGYPFPMFIVLLISGFMMVSLVTRLGREGLVDRNAIAGSVSPSLLILMQLTYGATMFDNGYPLLDQTLIPAVLLIGALVVLIACDFPWAHFSGNRGAKLLPGIGSVFLAAWFSSSLWNPVTTGDLKSYVASFDQAKFSSASWQRWQVPAKWLRDSQEVLDLTKPHAMLQVELMKDEPNMSILCSAIQAGLFQPQDFDRVHEFSESKRLLFDPYNRGRPFVSLGPSRIVSFHALVMRGNLNEKERDFLGDRLAASMQSFATRPVACILEEQLAITQLARFIDRPLDSDSYRDSVHQTLVSLQCLSNRFGRRRGGFSSNSQLNFSNENATAAAIELMQLYGVPAGVRIDALRSYLRPSFSDQWSPLKGMSYMRAASLQRLQSLPDVQPVTWQDYFRHEQSLMMAILFTLVCVFATLAAPKLQLIPTR